MNKTNKILTGILIAVGAGCVISTAGCSYSEQTNIGFTAGRTSAALVAVLGLISVVIGGMALRTVKRRGSGNGRVGGVLSLALGGLVMVFSVLHLGSSNGGFGSGSGRAGAIAALILGLIGINLGGLALARSRSSRRTD